uniref:Uncharacterized protein n=1 Tax=Arundo donax TaxID=35708 RepID=A0A0A8ZGJ5_ARUDO
MIATVNLKLLIRSTGSPKSTRYLDHTFQSQNKTNKLEV